MCRGLMAAGEFVPADSADDARIHRHLPRRSTPRAHAPERVADTRFEPPAPDARSLERERTPFDSLCGPARRTPCIRLQADIP